MAPDPHETNVYEERGIWSSDWDSELRTQNSSVAGNEGNFQQRISKQSKLSETRPNLFKIGILM